MIEVDIPGRHVFRFQHLLLDLNGTISLDGDIISGVAAKLDALRDRLNILIVTADTLGKARALGETLGIQVHRLEPGSEQAQKLALAQRLDATATAATGNGSNDAAMLRESVLGICVLGAEGASAETVESSDVLVPDINAALELFIKPSRLIATLRK